MSLIRQSQMPTNEHFVACDPGSLQVMHLAKRVAHFNVPVLISGETGTGKECIARYIHALSVGKRQPYVAINCSAIPENMLEALLFGYQRGAFTGAVSSVAGKFELANGGSLLLDEIGEMPLALQAKILRVLQEREVERLGSHQAIPLNIRVIAATNRDLLAEVSAGRFRKDLYYRLSVVPLHILPLRERRQDILPLAELFLAKFCQQSGLNITLSVAACEALLRYDWPGNVRELENVIQRGLIMAQGSQMTAMDLGLFTVADCCEPVIDVLKSTIKHCRQQAEYQYIADLLKHHQGNKRRTAAALGITPRALRYRLAAMRQRGFDAGAVSCD